MRKITGLSMYALLFILLVGHAFVIEVSAWSNGGYSDDPSNPDYGTHDWIAQHALDWLSSNEKEYIENNLAIYLYGTELPDNGQASDGIGDTVKHHIYYFSNGTLQDDSSAVRASEEYNTTLSYLNANDFENAAKHAGIMTHYIADVAVFGHVMGSGTDWGAEEHHSDHENYVNSRTNSYDDDFNTYLSYDGSLDTITAYDAAKNLANDTTFDVDGDLTCAWMEQNYDWNNSTFRDRCGESLNLAVNYLTDVLHTLYMSQSNTTGMNRVVINEFELNPSGNDNYLTILEWVELYNPTASSVDISGWTLSTTHGATVTVTIPLGTDIEANGYYVYERGQQWLDNTDESIILKNSSGVEIDRTPTKSDGDNDDYCWARFPNGYDTDSSSDWKFQSATKGASNGRASSSISCSLTSTFITINETTTIEGTISLARSGIVVHIWYSEDGVGYEVLENVVTNSSGGYTYDWSPSKAKTYNIKAGWDGDAYYIGANSSVQTLEVTYGIIWDGVTYITPIDTNSTISSFSFDQSAKKISFNVTGTSSTVGYCNVTIPIALLGGPYIVLVDGSFVTPIETHNSTHTSLYFTYTHSIHKVEIIGTTVIPEFPVNFTNLIVLTALAGILIFIRKNIK